MTSIELAREAIARVFGPAFWVRIQGPVHLDPWSAPEPDIAVISGTPRENFGKGHPKTVLLVVEISDTSLAYDRREKGPRYAKAGYSDYWIVNLVKQHVEVYRKPVKDPSAPLGWRYGEVSILKPPATVTPLAASTPIAIADLLPIVPATDKPANS